MSNERQILDSAFVSDCDDKEGKFLTMTVSSRGKKLYVSVTDIRLFCKAMQIQKLSFQREVPKKLFIISRVSL